MKIAKVDIQSKMNSNMKKFNKMALTLLIVFSGYFSSKACTGLPTPVLTASNIVGNFLYLNMNSVSIWMGCSYSVEVELICAGQVFPGVAPFYYTSPSFVKNANPQAIPQMTISLAPLCQGGAYQFRWRETYSNWGFSPWSAAINFTMPGVPIPSSASVSASPTAICYPQTSQFTSTISGGCGGGGGISYTWTPATGLSCVNCPSPTANPSVTTTYTLLVSGSNPGACWSASTTITLISFTAVPTVGTPSLIPNLCEGQANQISISSSSGSRQWEFATTPGGPWAIMPGETGTTVVTPTLGVGNYCYRLVTTGCGGSMTSTPICAQVFPNPTISVNSASICQGGTVTLVGNGATQFYWSAGIGSISATNGTANPPVTTAYTATGSANGCTATTAFNISVTPYPIVNLNSNSPICIGGTINLNTTGGTIYQWTGPNGFLSTLQTPSIGGAVPAMSGVYNVNVIDNTCATTGSIQVDVLNPLVTATNPGVYCAGTNVQLFANGTGVTTYNWSGPGYNSNAQNPIINNAQVSASGVYTVVASDGFCNSTATTAVLINPLPNPVLLSNSPICEMDTLVLNASGALSYVVTGPLNYTSAVATSSIFSTPANASGIYSVSATDGNGCVNGATLNVTVLALPPLNVKGNEVCIGNSATIAATGAVAYSWVGPNGFVSNQAIISFPSVQPSQTGSYVVTATAANGCSLTAGTTLTVFPTPVPSITVTPNVCLGGILTFSSQGGLLYTWLGPDEFVSHDQNTTIQATNVGLSGTYTLGVIDSKGCKGETTANVLVRPLPVATINANANNKCVPYCADYSLNSTSILQTVYWNMNNTGTSIGINYNYCFTSDGSRVLRSTYIDQYGCSNTGTFAIDVYPIPKADFNFAPTEIEENDQVQFTDASRGPHINKWEWTFGSDPNLAFYQNPTYTYDKKGGYPVTLIIANKFGCKDTITKALIVEEGFNLFVPNVFSPNGDGVNDGFQPKGLGVIKYKMEIFDQWGVKIFMTEDFNTPWDGTVKGKIGKDDTFVYKITAGSAKGKVKEYTGHVSILK